ncbi:MAG TPA: SRPBCC domain-containing protein [Gaiellales bacterium]|jgi:uncharacterized protein YndB with AHSA1/START domain
MPQELAPEIVRSVVLAADRETVWRAISSDDGLAGWLADTASVDIRPGGTGSVGFAGGHVRRLRVDDVTAGETIAFRWAPETMPEAETRVELRLEDAADGATRITVVERGFAQAATRGAGRVAASAWAWEAALAALVALLVLVAVA